MGHCLFMRKGETHTAPVSYNANFVDNTWEQIIDACQKNAVPDTWLVGDQKSMTINGTDYAIDIIGKNHDDYADGSGKAPLTFQLHDCYETTYQMNKTDTNIGGWEECSMRNTYLPAILQLMQTSVQTCIREVSKKSSAGNESATINTTNEKLFLLSEIEIFGSVTYSYSGEGSQYDYYKAGNSTVKERNGNASVWWERSPYYGMSSNFCIVLSGGSSNRSNANSADGVSFAFCF